MRLMLEVMKIKFQKFVQISEHRVQMAFMFGLQRPRLARNDILLEGLISYLDGSDYEVRSGVTQV